MTKNPAGGGVFFGPSALRRVFALFAVLLMAFGLVSMIASKASAQQADFTIGELKLERTDGLDSNQPIYGASKLKLTVPWSVSDDVTLTGDNSFNFEVPSPFDLSDVGNTDMLDSKGNTIGRCTTATNAGTYSGKVTCTITDENYFTATDRSGEVALSFRAKEDYKQDTVSVTVNGEVRDVTVPATQGNQECVICVNTKGPNRTPLKSTRISNRPLTVNGQPVTEFISEFSIPGATILANGHDANAAIVINDVPVAQAENPNVLEQYFHAEEATKQAVVRRYSNDSTRVSPDGNTNGTPNVWKRVPVEAVETNAEGRVTKAKMTIEPPAEGWDASQEYSVTVRTYVLGDFKDVTDVNADNFKYLVGNTGTFDFTPNEVSASNSRGYAIDAFGRGANSLGFTVKKTVKGEESNITSFKYSYVCTPSGSETGDRTEVRDTITVAAGATSEFVEVAKDITVNTDLTYTCVITEQDATAEDKSLHWSVNATGSPEGLFNSEAKSMTIVLKPGSQNSRVGIVEFENTYTREYTSVRVDKTWATGVQDADRFAVTFQLLRNGVAVENATKTLQPDATPQSVVFENLPALDANGERYTYSVKETADSEKFVDPGEVKATGDSNGALVAAVENTVKTEESIDPKFSVSKVLADPDNGLKIGKAERQFVDGKLVVTHKIVVRSEADAAGTSPKVMDVPAAVPGLKVAKFTVNGSVVEPTSEGTYVLAENGVEFDAERKPVTEGANEFNVEVTYVAATYTGDLANITAKDAPSAAVIAAIGTCEAVAQNPGDTNAFPEDGAKGIINRVQFNSANNEGDTDPAAKANNWDCVTVEVPEEPTPPTTPATPTTPAVPVVPVPVPSPKVPDAPKATTTSAVPVTPTTPVQAKPSKGMLANTGAGVLSILLSALLLVIAGALLVAHRKRS